MYRIQVRPLEYALSHPWLWLGWGRKYRNLRAAMQAIEVFRKPGYWPGQEFRITHYYPT